MIKSLFTLQTDNGWFLHWNGKELTKSIDSAYVCVEKELFEVRKNYPLSRNLAEKVLAIG